MSHIPVLKNEVLEYLAPKENENFIDATVGLGGHSKAILERNVPEGRVLGIEWDKELYEKLSPHKPERLVLVNDSYTNLKTVAGAQGFDKVSGVLFDFGFSSWHIESSGRGFTFQKDEPLDMRFNKEMSLTAYEIVNTWPQKEIEKVLFIFGEEPFARRIAQTLVELRKQQEIKTTFQLAELVKNSIPRRFHFGAIHPATRTFQALRMVVNKELENINKALPQALEVLAKGGRLVAISFHSLEDRVIKNFFRDNEEKGVLEVLTKKPITASQEELALNPRARSAKLRVAVKS